MLSLCFSQRNYISGSESRTYGVQLYMELSSTSIQTELLETQLHIKHCIRVSHGNLMFCVPAANKMVETLADDAAKDV